MFFTRPLHTLLFVTLSLSVASLGGDPPAAKARPSTASMPARAAAATSSTAPTVQGEEPLVIPRPTEGGFNVHDLLIEYGARTNQVIVFSGSSRDSTLSQTLSIDRGFLAPADGLHSVVESLLVQHGYFLSVQRESTPRILAVHGILDNRQAQRPLKFAHFVPEKQLQSYLEHPALMIETILTLEHLDAQELGSKLRSRTTTNNCDLVLAMAHQVILTGLGRDVARTALLLRQMNDTAGELSK